jgi:hypothetical protein
MQFMLEVAAPCLNKPVHINKSRLALLLGQLVLYYRSENYVGRNRGLLFGHYPDVR